MDRYDFETQLDLAARIVREASYVMALVGAGLSKESGIPTFRGGDGLWDKHGEPPMDGYQRFVEDPAGWWAQRLADQEKMGEFTKSIEEAQPNAGHIALAEMEQEGLVQHVITQNIDNLHQVAGSLLVTEIHGNRTKMRCIECSRRWPRADFPSPTLRAGSSEEVPRCPDCGGLVKSDTVMFGEPIPRDALASCQEVAQQADVALLIGTSAAVYPAAEFPLMVYRAGGVMIEVNPQETPMTEHCAAVLRAPSGDALPALLRRALALRGG